MASPGPSRRNRVRAALAAAAVQCGLAVAVIWGLAARGAFSPEREAAIVAVPLAPSPTPTPSRQPEPAGGSAPPGLPADRAPRAQPSPAVVLADPTPSITGGDADGGGGSGAGSGSGSGSGSGAGSGTGEVAVRVAGALSDRDYPRAARGAGGTVAIRFRVRADGGVDQCHPIASSGVSVLDDLTCELVERRFRYRPARDAYGQPIDSEQRTSFTWGARGR